MTASLDACRQALAARLGSVAGLNVSADYVMQVNPPAAVIFPQPGHNTQFVAMGGVVNRLLSLVLLVSWVAVTDAQVAMDALLDQGPGADPSKSVLASLAADPSLGGVVSYAVPTLVSSYSTRNWGGEDYLGCEILVEVAPLQGLDDLRLLSCRRPAGSPNLPYRNGRPPHKEKFFAHTCRASRATFFRT